MKSLLTLILVAATVTAGPIHRPSWFDDATLRIDLVHAGNAAEEWLMVTSLIREPIWAGPVHGEPEPYPVGAYQVTVRDPASGAVLYQTGFNTMFSEYQTTGPAGDGVRKAFEETVRVPWPKRTVVLRIDRRNPDHSLHPLLERKLDPTDIAILRPAPRDDVTVMTLAGGGDPHTRLDLVIVADGYTAGERDQAVADARHFADRLLAMAPYRAHRDRITVRLAFSPSQDRGCTMPTRGIYKRTAVGSSFNSLGLPRYLLTEHHHDFRDIAGAAPYDIAVIMVNTDRYGGGGIYNFYCVFTAHHSDRDYLFLHEFGHAFAGLADEYYSSAVTYSDFYPKGIEPLEPNITALLDPARLKWGDQVTPGTPVPTPWDKELYDRRTAAYQAERERLNREIARLTRSGATGNAITAAKEKLTTCIRDYAAWSKQFFANHPMKGRVGAFEGAGYSNTGLYRPMLDCLMFSRGEKPFCRVCERAVDARIRWYTGE